MRVAILALQGAVQPHLRKFGALGAEAVAVRTAEELAPCAGLVIPGGESTTLLKLIADYSLEGALRDFAASRPVWGVCAGAIVMAATVENPPQHSLAMLQLTARRNAYGRQNESFIAEIALALPGASPAKQEAVFIRAPQLTAWQPEAVLLAQWQGLPVALQQGRHLVTTFHPELSAPDLLHGHFLELCGRGQSRETA